MDPIDQYILQNGIIDGRVGTIEMLATFFNVKPHVVINRISKRTTELVTAWGLDPVDPLSLELVRSLESVRRAQADLERLLFQLRTEGGSSKSLSDAIGMQAKLARQRDSLIVKLQTEARRNEESRRKRGADRAPINITINDGEI